jgi:hypothetical protein
MNAKISVPDHRTTFCIAEQTKNLKRVITDPLGTAVNLSGPNATRTRHEAANHSLTAGSYRQTNTCTEICRWLKLG